MGNTVRIWAKILAFEKPDDDGKIYRGPVDLSHVDPIMNIHFDSASVGRLLSIEQNEEGIFAVYEVQREASELAPVACLSVPSGQVEFHEGVKLMKLGLVSKDEAILPDGFMQVKTK